MSKIEEKELDPMYEEYMDEAEFDKINEIDNEEEEEEFKTSKKEQTYYPFPTQLLIPMKTFVNEYLGVQHNCKNLWHSGLKNLGSMWVFGVDNNYANLHPERVYDRDLLIVIDSRGNRGTYVNPLKLRELLNTDFNENQADLITLGLLESRRLFHENFMQLLHEAKKDGKFRQLLKIVKTKSAYKIMEENIKERSING